MNFIEITKEYYSKWLGVLPDIMYSKGVVFIESPERDIRQNGYSQIFDIYIYADDNLVVVSYNKRLSCKIVTLKNKIQCGMSADQIVNIIEEFFTIKTGRSLVFYYDKVPNNIDTSNVIKLVADDFLKYSEFYMTLESVNEIDSWVKEYFYDLVSNELIYGILDDNKLVSVAQAPSMPYMDGKVQEIGIDTLQDYRRKGYAKLVSLASAKSIVGKGKCPIWSCRRDNTASEKLAYSIGFKKLAEVITVSI